MRHLGWEKKEELAETDKLHQALQVGDFGWSNWITEEGHAWFIDPVETWLDDPAGEEAVEQFSVVRLANMHCERLDYETLDCNCVRFIEDDHPGRAESACCR